MHRANPRAGQHGHGRLGDHRHIDDHAVALLHPHLAQQASQPCDLIAQLLEGETGLMIGNGRVVDQRQLLAASQFYLVIQRQITAVELSVGEPAMGAVGHGLQRLFGRVIPGHLPRLLGPIRLRRVDGLLMMPGVMRACGRGASVIHPWFPVIVFMRADNTGKKLAEAQAPATPRQAALASALRRISKPPSASRASTTTTAP